MIHALIITFERLLNISQMVITEIQIVTFRFPFLERSTQTVNIVEINTAAPINERACL